LREKVKWTLSLLGEEARHRRETFYEKGRNSFSPEGEPKVNTVALKSGYKFAIHKVKCPLETQKKTTVILSKSEVAAASVSSEWDSETKAKFRVRDLRGEELCPTAKVVSRGKKTKFRWGTRRSRKKAHAAKMRMSLEKKKKQIGTGRDLRKKCR